MKPHHRKKAFIGIGIGIPILVIGIILTFAGIGPPWINIPFYLIGAPLYVWGCLALANAKGYSTAIVLTVVLGILFPLVVLLALPDKNRYYRERRS